LIALLLLSPQEITNNILTSC